MNLISLIPSPSAAFQRDEEFGMGQWEEIEKRIQAYISHVWWNNSALVNRDGLRKGEARASSSRNSPCEVGEGKMRVSWMEREQEREFWQHRQAWVGNWNALLSTQKEPGDEAELSVVLFSCEVTETNLLKSENRFKCLLNIFLLMTLLAVLQNP